MRAHPLPALALLAAHFVHHFVDRDVADHLPQLDRLVVARDVAAGTADGDNLRLLSIVESAEQTSDGVRYKEPKSGRARTVALSAATVAELKAHRTRQAEEQLRLGIRPDADSFVVAQVDGSPLQPRSLTHEWIRVIGNTTLPRIRFHDLRHTHATQMLSAGVHPKVASERLGHSTIGITLDLYSHVMPGMQADAAEAVDAAIRSAVKPGS